MKKILFFLIATMLLACGCNKPVETTTPPTIVLSDVSATATTVTFAATVTDATSAAYVILPVDETLPALDAILSQGTAMDLSQGNKISVNAAGLESATEYQIIAAASNDGGVVGSNTLYVTTLAQGEMSINVEIVQVDHEKMHFRVKSENVEELAYLVLYSTKETPEASYVFLNGEEIEVGSNESVPVTSLECNKEYKLVVAGRSGEQTYVPEPLIFKTDDDPANVISHDYTRAKGFKWSSNAYIMLAYEGADGDLAYDETMLCLDFYVDPEIDYLPAGVYEVDASNEPPVLSSFYSTYGYEDGVKLKSGTVEVLIDEETKAYTFNADIYLIDGRHMVATYTGDVEGMEVVDIITLNTVFTSAAAQKLESDGSNWLLTLSDDAGNTAVIDLFTYATPYIPESSYTIQFEDITTTEFDGNTSYFILAEEPETEVGFATGTLHVTIDWDNKIYDLSFYGSLTNGVVLETSYEGEIEGVSLEQSTEVINLEMTGATAHSNESGANWYLTFTDKEEQHRLTIDAYCTPSQALPEGQYVLGTGQGKIAYDATSIRVEGEGQFNFQEVTMDVTIDYTARTYRFDITGKIMDGRTYVCVYEGEVVNMDVVDKQEGVVEVEWTKATVKHWYSNNWQLLLEDASGQYMAELDLYTEVSDYIGVGTYTLQDNTDAFSIKDNYSYFYYLPDTANKFYYSEAVVVVAEGDSADNYSLEVTLKLTNGAEFSGTFNGPFTPKQ